MGGAAAALPRAVGPRRRRSPRSAGEAPSGQLETRRPREQGAVSLNLRADGQREARAQPAGSTTSEPILL